MLADLAEPPKEQRMPETIERREQEFQLSEVTAVA